MGKLSDPAAERGVISGICKFGKAGFFEVSDLLSSQTFTVDLNVAMYSCLQSIFAENSEAQVDLHIILSTAAKLSLGKFFENDHTYIQRVLNFGVEFANLRTFAKKIRKLQLARELIDKCDESKDKLLEVNGEESVGEITSIPEKVLFEYVNSISANSSDGPVTIGTGLREYVKFLGENPQEIVGISTGYPRLDSVMGGGIRRKSVLVIAARSGIGKTFIADHLSLHAAGKIQIPVLELDTEMDLNSHWPRILGIMSGVAINEIETGKFATNPDKKRRVDNAVNKLEKIPYSYVNVSGKSFEEIISIARRWVLQKVGFSPDGRTKDCLIVFDYLKMMNDAELKSGVMKEYQVLGFQMTALHDFAVQYDVPVASFVQVNRDGITKETSDIIADSDRILRLASSVFLYKVKEPEEVAEDGPAAGNRKMVHIKTRYGGGIDQGNYINFTHTKDTGRIKELSLKSEARSSGESVPVSNEQALVEF